MIRKYYELTCDACGCTEHFPIGLNWKTQARNYGWIISKRGAFCTDKCFKPLNPAPDGK